MRRVTRVIAGIVANLENRGSRPAKRPVEAGERATVGIVANRANLGKPARRANATTKGDQARRENQRGQRKDGRRANAETKGDKGRQRATKGDRGEKGDKTTRVTKETLAKTEDGEDGRRCCWRRQQASTGELTLVEPYIRAKRAYSPLALVRTLGHVAAIRATDGGPRAQCA